MRIAVDARCLNVPHVRGIGKMVTEVVTRLAKRDLARFVLFADRPDLPMHVPRLTTVEAEVHSVRGYRWQRWEQLHLPWRARRSGCQLLHCVANTAPLWQPIPTVISILDTIPWEFGERSDHGSWYWDWILPLAFRRAAAVITISQSSRRDIERRWQAIPPIYVVPLGVADAYFEMVEGAVAERLRAQGVRRPYLLYLGGAVRRKRLDLALHVFKEMQARDVQLVVCGLEKNAHEQIRSSMAPDLQSRLILMDFVAEEDMPSLYQNATAVLYPTLYEGFGLPVVEAQAVGTPVLMSDVGSLAELIGPGTFVLPAEDRTAWVATAQRLIQERRNTVTPNRESQQWARAFSWDRCAEKTRAVYEDVVRSRS